MDRVIGHFRSLVASFRGSSQAHLIIHSLEAPAFPRGGVLDGGTASGQYDLIRRINRGLQDIARQERGVYLLDYDGLVARHGRLLWRDDRKWWTMRMPIRADHLCHMATEWMRFIQPLTGRICKVLVTDLDNTLWGGVIGEDGMAGIALGQEYPGAVFQGVQRAMLDLFRRGILLAVCSKNNEADAMEVLDLHPGMLLRPHHFAAIRINWEDKVRNLREIASELNVALDSLAFLDDNPAEREFVRVQLPEVTVIEPTDDPMSLAPALRNAPAFERLEMSQEDLSRGRLYAEQRQRSDLLRSSESVEDFYHSLNMVVDYSPVTGQTLMRAAQLTQKTNQFNMTTKRYSEQQLSGMMGSSEWGIYAIGVKDRFGDNGLVGVAILHYMDTRCDIDTFLLSCRVIGRTIETAFLSLVRREAIARGVRILEGRFIPSAKNAPARDFYPAHGFVSTDTREPGTLWQRDITADTDIVIPPWITVETKCT
jgi:FkbH-like protein